MNQLSLPVPYGGKSCCRSVTLESDETLEARRPGMNYKFQNP